MSNSNNPTPHAHILGSKVTIPEDIQTALEISWSEGVVVAALENAKGLAIHVANAETGEVAPAITLDAVRLPPGTITLLETANKMNAAILQQVSGAFQGWDASG